MNSTVRRSAVALAALVLLAATGQARAEVRADVFSTIEFPFVDQTVIDPSTAEAGPASASEGADGGQMHAIASLEAASLLQAQISAAINGSNVRTAIANASWLDVLVASGASPPSEVRFNFTIEGDFNYTNVTGGSQFSPNVSRAIANITTRTNLSSSPLDYSSDIETTQVGANDLMVRVEKISEGANGSSFDAQAFAGSSQAWLSESLVENSPGLYHFSGTFGVVSALKTPAQLGFGATNDGYAISLGMTALGQGRGSTSGVDLFNTMQLSSITLPDGSPLPETFDTVFESGLVFPAALDGDLDGDGFVGIADLNIVLGNWNQTIPPGDPLADPSGDNFVGIEDLNTVLGNWNAGTPPAAANIPEPATWVLLAAAMTGFSRRR